MGPRQYKRERPRLGRRTLDAPRSATAGLQGRSESVGNFVTTLKVKSPASDPRPGGTAFGPELVADLLGLGIGNCSGAAGSQVITFDVSCAYGKARTATGRCGGETGRK